MLHDVTKAGIECDVENTRTKASLQAARDMEFVGKEDGPGIGGPPQDGLVFVIPGENTVAVGFEQSLRAQVASDGE